MSARDNGGPAFPRPASEAHQHGMHRPQDGMTLRDYFAAKAMQAIVRTVLDNPQVPTTEATIAKDAYIFADAMLKAREK